MFSAHFLFLVRKEMVLLGSAGLGFWMVYLWIGSFNVYITGGACFLELIDYAWKCRILSIAIITLLICPELYIRKITQAPSTVWDMLPSARCRMHSAYPACPALARRWGANRPKMQ